MMDRETYFQANAPQVVHETIDGETILLNLESGIYYSLNDTGGVLWALMESGRSQGQIIGQVADHYETDQVLLESMVDAFFDELKSEGLVVPSRNPRQTNGDHHVIPALGELAKPNRPFEKPLLSKYTDMQDLLLLDPIHDVDDSGWPTAKAN
jgi:hypothetical protein